MDSEPQSSEPKNERIRVKNLEFPAFLWHPQSCEMRGACSFLSLVWGTGKELSFHAQSGEKHDGCRADKREGLGCRSRVAAGDRCRGFGKGRDFPCKIHSNSQRGNPIPGRESELRGTPEGPPEGPRAGGMGEERWETAGQGGREDRMSPEGRGQGS